VLLARVVDNKNTVGAPRQARATAIQCSVSEVIERNSLSESAYFAEARQPVAGLGKQQLNITLRTESSGVSNVVRSSGFRAENLN
jgi:hypothetical protein